MAIQESCCPGGVLGLLVWVSALFHRAIADTFTNPSNDNTDLSIHYTLGTTVQITWDCSLDSITLVVAHWGGNDVGALLSDVQNSGSYSWKIGELDNISDDQISESANFVLIIRDPTGAADTSGLGGFVDGQLQSRAFVIDSPDGSGVSASSSSSSSSMSESVSSSISSASSLTSFAATTTSASIPTTVTSTNSVVPSPTRLASTDSRELSTVAKVGIGVGAALGGLLLLGLGTFVGIRLTRRRPKREQQAGFQAESGTAGTGLSETYYQEQKPGTGSYGFQSVSELPSGPYSREYGPVHELGGR